MLRAMLFDVDGVLRHFDPAQSAAIEAAHGLARGSLVAQAFSPALLLPAIRGEISRAQWIERLGEVSGSPAAAAALLGLRGRADPEMVVLIEELASRGVAVGVLSNATDTLAEELSAVGLSGCFRWVLSSSALGAAKPEPEVYRRALAVLGLPAGEVGFTDDQAKNVDAARAVGLQATPFRGVSLLRTWIAARRHDK